MARTIRRNGADGREDFTITGIRPWYRRERKHARKATARAVRNGTREVLATTVDHDAAIYPTSTRTGGWLSH